MAGTLETVRQFVTENFGFLAITYTVLFVMATTIYLIYRYLKSSVRGAHKDRHQHRHAHDKYTVSVSATGLLFNEKGELQPEAKRILTLLAAKCDLFLVVRVRLGTDR